MPIFSEIQHFQVARVTMEEWIVFKALRVKETINEKKVTFFSVKIGKKINNFKFFLNLKKKNFLEIFFSKFSNSLYNLRKIHNFILGSPSSSK